MQTLETFSWHIQQAVTDDKPVLSTDFGLSPKRLELLLYVQNLPSESLERVLDFVREIAAEDEFKQPKAAVAKPIKAKVKSIIVRPEFQVGEE